jgi:hypothetical protein
MVLPSLKARNGSEKLPPVASAPLIGGRKPVKPNEARVIVKVQLALFPAASVAMQVTGDAPTGKRLPEGGLQVTVPPAQLSDAAGLG